MLSRALVAGMGPIHLNEVRCTGTEASLWSCPYKNITEEGCKHSEDAGVRCNIPYMGYETTVSTGPAGVPLAGPHCPVAAPCPRTCPSLPPSWAAVSSNGTAGTWPGTVQGSLGPWGRSCLVRWG